MECIIATVVAAGVVLFMGPVLLPILKELKFGQSIREEGPKSHAKKSGTPTMGGIMIVLGIMCGAVASMETSPVMLLALFITLGHFALGFADDYIKVVKKQNLGLRAREKFLGQIAIAIVAIVIARSHLGIETTLWIPFVNTELDIGVLYYPLVLFAIVGASNAVNLTDGLDGLAAGTVGIAAAAYGVVCLLIGNEALAPFAFATMAASLAFLAFNKHPAKVFMGDTGSLALGGAFAALGIMTHTELLLVVIGFVFVCEALSVIIQVISFQTTGKRVFRMSPIHHHFELGGWKEVKVVKVFWCAGLISAIVGVGAVMLR